MFYEEIITTMFSLMCVSDNMSADALVNSRVYGPDSLSFSCLGFSLE